MLAQIRDRKGQGNAALYVRVRDELARYWNFSTSAWDAVDSSDCDVFLVEYADSDPYDSRYQKAIILPQGAADVEYVKASTSEVVGEDAAALYFLIQSLTTPTHGDGQMLLSAHMLVHVMDANTFEYVDTASYTETDGPYVYFQLVDASDPQETQRYIPDPGSTMEIVLQSVDSANTVTRAAEMAFPLDDRSIWRVKMEATDGIVGSRDMRIALTELASLTHGVVKQAITVQPLSPSSY